MGVLLFRGFTTDTEIFREFSNLFSNNFLDYTGGAFDRRVINDDKTILSVNDFQTDIKLHGEMYYQKNIPLMLWFFCANPAAKNGETTVCDGRQFFAELSNSTQELFSQKRLKFTAKMNKEQWQKKYKIDDINELEQMCKMNDTHTTIYEDQSILLQYICPVVIPSRCGKYQVFINSLLPAMQLNPDVLKFDDDSEISDELMDELNGIAERITTNIDWKKGDILMIDNTRIMHGRRAFKDETREIYIRLCSPNFQF
ncbi:MAG: TauD/TfdA family dioxygenase [Nostocales cyanobacterium ELA608]